MQAHVQRITAMYDVNACMSVGWTWPLNETRYISLFIYFILNTLVSRLFCTCHSMCCCLLKNNRNVSMWHAAWASLLTTKEANSSQHCTKGTATASCYVNGNKLWHCSCCLGFLRDHLGYIGNIEPSGIMSHPTHDALGPRQQLVHVRKCRET